MLKKSFPGAPLIYGLGNNDAVCGDYKVAPAQHDARASRPRPAGRRRQPHRRCSDFAAGGFYVVPHPTVPRHDMIVLNSVFWSAKYHRQMQRARPAIPARPSSTGCAWTLAPGKARRAHRHARHAHPARHRRLQILESDLPGHRRASGRSADTRRFLALVAADKDCAARRLCRPHPSWTIFACCPARTARRC